jgi:two-component system sensor histidine kinase KdpD
MNHELRPNPDKLLAAIQQDQARQGRGKLKIFFGMAAGVGKTYAMLEAAQAQRQAGADVVVGYVETHKRTETEAILRGLEIIPRAKIEYRGHILEEMDLDAVIQRHPQIVLVDELAHTNAPGARHPKRYQDVLELLDAGINVFTTLNVQHLESRADTVYQITSIVVRETVPDSVFSLADEVELVDLTPEELRQRLNEGKVYVPESAQVAINNFFRVGNLTALREMALRLTAECVDHQLKDYMSLKQIAGPWKSGERLMVAVSSSPLTERLVRWTRRMAYNLDAPWLAVNVETAQPLSEEEKRQLAHNLALARELGGEVITTTDENIVVALLRVARERNVTQIIVGKPDRHFFFDLLHGGATVDRLIRTSGDLDIYVVTGDAGSPGEIKHGRRLGDVYVRLSRVVQTKPLLTSTAREYLIAVLVIIAVVGISLLALQFISYQAVGLILLFAVSFLAVFIGRGPVLVAATLSALLWNFLFIPPTFTFIIAGIENVMMFALYFVIALATGTLTSRLRAQRQAIREREKRTEALYAMARAIASAPTMDDVLNHAVTQIKQGFGSDVAFLLRQDNGQLSYVAHSASTLTVDDKEHSVAAWVFLNRKPAGCFTDTLPFASARWLPLMTPNGVVGVMGVGILEQLSIDQTTLLETFASQIALAIEREMLNEAAARASLVAKSEQLYKTLLDSVSHELRTPIAAITGAATTLMDSKTAEQADTRNALIEEIRLAADRLNRLVENLLDMTRLESGMLKLRLDWCDVGDLISVTLNRLKPFLEQHQVVVDLPLKLPLVRLDFVLIEQALHNLIHNSAVYTPRGTRIRIAVKMEASALVITVSDRGPGIPPEVLSKIFDKFYRAPGVQRGGVGLGLSIARGLIEAHGGTLRAENRERGGISFIIRLPQTEHPPVVAETEAMG